jgi:hypothetical protein
VTTPPLGSWWAVKVLRQIGILPAAVFVLFLTLAMSPNLIHIYGIHNDYEALTAKRLGFFHAETDQLLAVGRPVAALLSNLPILPLHSLADFRWARLFSLLTAIIAGLQLIYICRVRLRTSSAAAGSVAITTFLALPYIYSILQPAAWAPHLVSTIAALAAYAVLSRTNVRALPFVATVEGRDLTQLWLQTRVYVSAPDFLRACLLMQVALYGYPPNALIVVLMPLAVILLSQAPHFYRTLIALRDILFIGVNLACYTLVTKFIYLPVIKLFVYRLSDEWQRTNLDEFDQRIAPSYSYGLNLDITAILARLRDVIRVGADLWFLPQYQFHIVVAITLVVVVVLINVRSGMQRHDVLDDATLQPLLLSSFKSGLLRTAAVFAICMLLACAPILLSSGGFVTYRTIPVACALVGLLFLYLAMAAALFVSEWLSLSALSREGWAVIGLAVVSILALGGNWWANQATFLLARNEFRYFEAIVKEAKARGSPGLALIDPRPFFLPEDIPSVVDRGGRPVPPFELGCLSSYCLQNGAIIQVLAAQFGWDIKPFGIQMMRGSAAMPGINCELLKAPTFTFPPQTARRTTEGITFTRTLQPLTCVMFSLDWHDLRADWPR